MHDQASAIVGAGEQSPAPAVLVPAVVANHGEDEFCANVRDALRRDIQWLQECPAHDGRALIVGGGPSLARYVDTIAAEARRGRLVIAINGAGDFLRKHGIAPGAQLCIDARALNARFFEKATGWALLGSCCHPDTFNAAAAAGARIIGFHPAVKLLMDIVDATWRPPMRAHYVGGGRSGGIMAMAVAYALGFRSLQLFGMDSCYGPAEAHHAYPQAENDHQAPQFVKVNGREFLCASWHVTQVLEFQEFTHHLRNMGCDVAAIGDGPLVEILRGFDRVIPADQMTYDLATQPSSYDFVAALIGGQQFNLMHGDGKPLRVGIVPGPNNGFRHDTLPGNVALKQQIHDQVIRPAIGLVPGAIFDPACVEGNIHNYVFCDIVARARAGVPVPMLEPRDAELQAVDAYLAGQRAVTITLRESEHWPARNSNLDTWRAVAAALADRGYLPVIVRDTANDMAPLPDRASWRGRQCFTAARDLHYRAALYQRAACNLFVANGPAALCFFGRAPWLMFNPLDPAGAWRPGTPGWWKRNHGIGPGEQFPWSTPQQRVIWNGDAQGKLWSDDDPAAIIRAFDEIMPPANKEPNR